MKIFKLDREPVWRGMWLALVMMVAFSEPRELRAQLAIRAGVLHTLQRWKHLGVHGRRRGKLPGGAQ